jgi:hypothetical protein
MDKAALVRSDLEIEGRVLDALSRADIPVALCDWNYVPEIDEWQLVVATPWYDRKGPHATYSSVIKALQDAGIYEEVPMRRLFIKSPDDSLVKTLEEELKVQKEGAIHIIAHNGSSDDKRYSVLFAPFSGPGGAVPVRHITGLRELRDFLETRLHVRRGSVDDALAELARRGATSLFHVQLTNRQAKRLGLG